VLLQVIAACYALSLDLRLQVLWSAKSAIIPGGYNVDVMCRCVWGGGRLRQRRGQCCADGGQGGGQRGGTEAGTVLRCFEPCTLDDSWQLHVDVMCRAPGTCKGLLGPEGRTRVVGGGG
jgi:hypothetical protein